MWGKVPALQLNACRGPMGPSRLMSLDLKHPQELGPRLQQPWHTGSFCISGLSLRTGTNLETPLLPSHQTGSLNSPEPPFYHNLLLPQSHRVEVGCELLAQEVQAHAGETWSWTRSASDPGLQPLSCQHTHPFILILLLPEWTGNRDRRR